jgi:hypothetical protein
VAVTEAEWLACEDPRKRVGWLRRLATDRKLRLFACAYWRWHTDAAGDGDPEMRRLLAYVERWADHGPEPPRESGPLPPVWARWHPVLARKATHAANWTIRRSAGPGTTSGTAAAEQQLKLLADVFGPLPFRPALLPASVLAWNGGCVAKLATAIYEGRDFSPERMGVLADALEEAGVTDEDLLRHCRRPGAVHVRGCWVVDLLTGRE